MCSIIRYIKLFSAVLKVTNSACYTRDFVSDLVLHKAYTKCKHVGHLITPWESYEVHEKIYMQADNNIWNLFIRTLSPPLNTYESFAKYESQPLFQRARSIEQV